MRRSRTKPKGREILLAQALGLSGVVVSGWARAALWFTFGDSWALLRLDMNISMCRRCGKPIPHRKPKDALFCSDDCRVRHWLTGKGFVYPKPEVIVKGGQEYVVSNTGGTEQAAQADSSQAD